MATRREMWEQLGDPVDVLVIGGGITGAGIARDAARRGLKVALIEMRDLAYGTSSRSSKLVHGGLRYLEHYEFSLVFEAVSERRILLDIAPHLVNPQGFLFPVYKNSRRSLWFINAGMWVYDGLSLFRSPKRHQTLKPSQLAEREPSLNQENLSGAPLYYDCATDDSRLTLETALDAAASGAIIATWTRVRSFVKDEIGRIQGVMVEDQDTGSIKEISARVVINATGPWTDRTLAMAGSRASGDLLRPTKGVHIVVEREKLPVREAVVCMHPDDGRVLFAIPWGARTYVGTTDTDYEGDPGEVHASLEDVDYLIGAAKAYFPAYPLVYEDVIATWAGLRPLITSAESEEGSESSVSREHRIVVGSDGLITIAGGKLTTYRRMAAEVVDTAINLLRLLSALPERLPSANTESVPLPGAVGWPEDDDHEAVAARIYESGKGAISGETAELLANTYGMRGLEVAKLAADNPALAAPLVPGRHEVLAQVDWAVTQELAHSCVDVLKRRTQLYFRDHDQGLGALPAVVARMAELLGWDAALREERADAYRKEVARSRRWREELAAR